MLGVRDLINEVNMLLVQVLLIFYAMMGVQCWATTLAINNVPSLVHIKEPCLRITFMVLQSHRKHHAAAVLGTNYRKAHFLQTKYRVLH